MVRGAGFVIVMTLALAGLGWAAVIAPDPARMAAYFPAALRVTVACNEPVLSGSQVNWYGQFLVAADEPSLWTASRGPAARAHESYRFTWLPSFRNPILIRLDRENDGRLWLTGTRLSGRGGYDPGAVEMRLHRPLDPLEEARFASALAAANHLRRSPRDCPRGTDGSEWILEANERGDYRYVNLWTPRDGATRRFAETLMGFSGLDREGFLAKDRQD